MTAVQVFKNKEFGEVRIVIIDGEPWFVGKDVAETLGYSNIRDAIIRHVDEEDKGVGNYDTLGGMQNLVIINESGLYSLILSSKKPEAKKFKRWVTSEVLPSIRKQGMYAVDDLLNNPDLAIKALTALKEEREKVRLLKIESNNQTQAIAEMKPKVSYYDMILRSKELMTITQIAKDYGLSGRKFNKILCTHKIQFKQSGQWYLYQPYAQRGYTQSRTYMYKTSNNMPHSKLLTCWTQEGRKFLYWFLRDLGIYPVVEQNTQQMIG